jgi:nuclear GTP-binding protein
MKKVPTKPARIEPNRKWFGNVRVIDQKSLSNLRKEIENQSHDTYSLLLKKRNIPASLITPMSQETKVKTLMDTFSDTFGKNSKRTKPNLNVFSINEYANQAQDKLQNYNQEKDIDHTKLEIKDYKLGAEEKFANAGQSKRIYRELHKVIDSSDVLCVVLDARDPLGTRSYYVENFIKKNAPHKHIIFILNKCDLIPTWATVSLSYLFFRQLG